MGYVMFGVAAAIMLYAISVIVCGIVAIKRHKIK